MLLVNISDILLPLYSRLLKFNVTDDILYLPDSMSIDSFNFGKPSKIGFKYIDGLATPPTGADSVISKLFVENPNISTMPLVVCSNPLSSIKVCGASITFSINTIGIILVFFDNISCLNESEINIMRLILLVLMLL